MTQPYDVEFASQQYQKWLVALKEAAMLATLNQSQAMMCAVMQELRDSVSDEDALVIANALPALARGVMLDGWALGARKHTVASGTEFYERLVSRLEPHQPPPEDIAEAVFSVWRRELPPHKAKQVAEKLPEALRPLWVG
ncbi:DUF2267 domain-containing protein [Marinicaulis aureus]|uniref:DUF2267 domain-containing protein n=1 Tax=Hyphococcus aureus TaxID=2666033 RepID=A0ABW1KUF6_9PROT